MNEFWWNWLQPSGRCSFAYKISVAVINQHIRINELWRYQEKGMYGLLLCILSGPREIFLPVYPNTRNWLVLALLILIQLAICGSYFCADWAVCSSSTFKGWLWPLKLLKFAFEFFCIQNALVFFVLFAFIFLFFNLFIYFLEEQKFSPINFCAAILGGLGAVDTSTRISQW